MKRFSGKIWLILIIWLVIDLGLWVAIATSRVKEEKAAVYFLDVGQGDAEMIEISGQKEVRMIIDGGPGNSVLGELSKILPWWNKRIDIVFSTHADLDHSSGLVEAVKRYPIGIFAWNGLFSNKPVWGSLARELQNNQADRVSLRAGDKIFYGKQEIEVLHPGDEVYGDNINTSSLVLLFKSGETKFLFTGDIDKQAEDLILENGLGEIDVLKVAHHGSKYSSGEGFLNLAKPEISVIEVGRNSYGHPTEEVLDRLTAVGSLIFRTDEEGTIKVEVMGDKLEVSAIK